MSPCARACAPKRGGLAGIGETYRILRRSGLMDPHLQPPSTGRRPHYTAHAADVRVHIEGTCQWVCSKRTLREPGRGRGTPSASCFYCECPAAMIVIVR